MAVNCDCIVLGVGGFGSGALYHLANRRVNAIGLEQFDIAHDRGSSHGESRIIRKAYFEHPDYVPLLHRSYELWRQLEDESGQSLMHLCGLMLAGPPDGEAIPGARLAASRYGVTLEDIPRDQFPARLPGFRIPEEFDVVIEPEAGYLEVEACVATHIEQARRGGATLKTGETVRNWSSDGRTVRVETDSETYEAASLIITAGPWSEQVLQSLGVPLRVVRKPMFWLPVESSDYDLTAGTPAFYYERPDGIFYGLPSLDGRLIRISEHSGGDEVADPSLVDRTIHQRDVTAIQQFVQSALPGVNPDYARHAVCLYTHSPDDHFLVDHHPAHENVVYGAGFSGHGFKFTSVLGQALAELAIDGRTDLPIDFLSHRRQSLQSKPES